MVKRDYFIAKQVVMGIIGLGIVVLVLGVARLSQVSVVRPRLALQDQYQDWRRNILQDEHQD